MALDRRQADHSHKARQSAKSSRSSPTVAEDSNPLVNSPLSELRRSGRNTPPDFVEASPMAIMKMSMEEARDYCDRLDAAKGKANGSAAAPAVAEVVETGPIARASATARG